MNPYEIDFEAIEIEAFTSCEKRLVAGRRRSRLVGWDFSNLLFPPRKLPRKGGNSWEKRALFACFKGCSVSVVSDEKLSCSSPLEKHAFFAAGGPSLLLLD